MQNPSPGGNHLERYMLRTFQANACGKHDYEDVEELEIIFDEATEIGNLDRMYQLRSMRSM